MLDKFITPAVNSFIDKKDLEINQILNTPCIGDKNLLDKVLKKLYKKTNERCKDIFIQEFKEKRTLEDFYILSFCMYPRFSIFNPSSKNNYQFFIYAFDKKHKDYETIKVLSDLIDIRALIVELSNEFYTLNNISLFDNSLIEFYKMLNESINEVLHV